MTKFILGFIILIASFSSASAESNLLCKIGGHYFEIKNVSHITYGETAAQIKLDSGSIIWVNGVNNFCLYSHTVEGKSQLHRQFKNPLTGPLTVIDDTKEE